MHGEEGFEDLLHPTEADVDRWIEQAVAELTGAEGFTCPCCGIVSRNPDDIRDRYCGACCWATGDHFFGPGHLDAPCRVRTERFLAGARVVRPDGTEIRCDLVRDVGGDEDGLEMWVAVPRFLYEPDPRDQFRLDILPAGTLISFRMPL